MTPEQYKKADPLMRRLERVQSCLKSMQKQCILEDESKQTVTTVENPFSPNWQYSIESEDPDRRKSSYNMYVGQFDDGSGIGISLDGCYLSHEIWKATYRILKDREALLLHELYGIEN
jgi:hypothetical protein